jgi:hypothetical protein
MTLGEALERGLRSSLLHSSARGPTLTPEATPTTDLSESEHQIWCSDSDKSELRLQRDRGSQLRRPTRWRGHSQSPIDPGEPVGQTRQSLTLGN